MAPLVGKLRDLGGPFVVDGTVTLTPPNAYLVQGFITGRTAEAERLVREITLGAMPDASGSQHLLLRRFLLARHVHFPPGGQQREIQAGAHRFRTQSRAPGARNAAAAPRIAALPSPESLRDRRPRADWS